jgi:hypothetical protein
MGKSKFYIGERVKIDIETLSITESYDFVNMIIKFDNENHKIHTITNVNYHEPKGIVASRSLSSPD